MALVVYDRVQETTTTTGTGAVTLLGAVAGFQTFAVVGNGNTTFYCIADQGGGTNWEVGVGTYSTTGPSLSRDTVLASSNSGSLVNFTTGTKSVFVTYPAEKSVNLDASGNVTALGTITSGVWNGTTIPVAYGGTGVTSSSGTNSVVLRDANGNVVFNNFTAGTTVVTAAAGTTVLTVSSSRNQILVGSTTQTFQLPNATTLTLGQSYLFVNNSSGALTVKDNAGTTVETVPTGGVTQLAALSIATSAGSWGAYSFLPGSYDFNTSTANFGGATITNTTYQGNTVQSGYGGTGLTTFTGANNALYSTSSSALTAGTLPILAGGTGSTTASGARTNLGAAASGANSDITSLSGLTTPLSVGQGGTGLSSVTANRIPYGNGTSALNTNVNFTYNGTTLLVGDSGGLGGATNPVVASVGSANNYVQSYVYNTTNGTNSSADFVAYPSNGTDANGWVDMGITSLSFNQAAYSVTGPNEAYLFGSSPATASTSVTGNLVYATDSNGSQNYHQWYVGGFNQAKNAWKMQLTNTGLQLANALAITYGGTGATTASAAFNNLSPITSTGDLIVGNGTNSATRLGIGTTGQVLTSNGTTATWASPSTGAGTITRTDFTATAGQTVFTVPYQVGLIDVYQNGAKLATTDFTATNGTSFTLATGAAAGDLIQAEVFSSLNLYATITTDYFSGDGSTTAFTMSVAPSSANATLVTISGVTQDPNSYTVSGTTLTFSAAPPAGTNNITARYLGVPSVTTVGSFSGGTTGLTPSSATSGAVTLGGVLNVANGGTGQSSLASNNVLLGNGTGGVQTVAPGASGNILTSNGTTWTSTANPPPFAAGTTLLFYQSAAPTGWTQVTTLNDYALRIVSGTGGTTGGTTAFSTVFTNQTPTINTSGLSAGATTLSTAQMPSHNHSVPVTFNGCGTGIAVSGGASFAGNVNSNSTGGGGSHSHSISGSATSSAITLNVQYANIIICSKN